MIFSTLALALFALPFASATPLNIHYVNVGPNGKLMYDPEVVYAHPGDVVKFIFNPKNHTVTQSSFHQPCVPNGGFNSGFMPVAAGQTDLPSFHVQVEDYNPVWVHCQQDKHCGSGMVFAINPPAYGPNSFEEFKKLAIAINGTATQTSVQPPATSTVNYYANYDHTPEPTYTPPSYSPVDHKISVGADGKLAFYPPNIAAAIGDTVTFQFNPKNHSVIQSSFDAPCQPLADTTHGQKVGFNSGFVPVAAGQTYLPTFTIKVEDDKPIWGFCGQTGHCGSGMVFSINADEYGPKSFAAFQALAIKINGTMTGSGSGSSHYRFRQ